MDEGRWLAEQFEQNRGHLRGVAYRILGSVAEADDAVQEAWLRLSRSDAGVIDNLGGWLTTVVARVCLDMLRSRQLRHEESLDAPGKAGGNSLAFARSRTGSRHGRLRWPCAPRRSRKTYACGTASIRHARHLRSSLRRNCSHHRTFSRCDPPTCQPRPPSRARRRPQQ